MEIVPVHNRLLVERLKAEEVSEGGIIIPDIAKKKIHRGIVHAVGDGERYQGKTLPMTVKKGDKVLFSELSGTEIKINDKDYVILREPDVHCILKEGKDG